MATAIRESGEAFRNRSVGEVVAENPARGAVFKRFGIDFCCGGGRSVEDACGKSGVKYDDLEEALRVAERATESALPDVREWPLDRLTDYIVRVHHRYVRESLPVLRAFSEKVARVHGEARPELVEIRERVAELDSEMAEHMIQEERVLFPRIDALQIRAAAPGGGLPGAAPIGVGQPITRMEDDHERAGNLMARIRELSDGFTPPPMACATYRSLFVKLAEFEEDLHWHVHLENNVLFPRAAALETAGGAA